MAFDRIFADGSEFDIAQGNNEFTIGELYLISDSMTVRFAIGSSESKPIFAEEQDVLYGEGRFGQHVNSLSFLAVDDVKVVGNREAALADATGGSTVDIQARAAINSLLARLRNHGLIAS